VCFGDKEWVGCGLKRVVLVSSSVVGCGSGFVFSDSFFLYIAVKGYSESGDCVGIM
jgi:hypothetical protein